MSPHPFPLQRANQAGKLLGIRISRMQRRFDPLQDSAPFRMLSEGLPKFP